jgi:hypothetical protein
MAELEFSNLNPYSSLEFVKASSPDELHKLLTGFRGPMKILAIYASGTQHIAWIQTGITKLKKGK